MIHIVIFDKQLVYKNLITKVVTLGLYLEYFVMRLIN